MPLPLSTRLCTFALDERGFVRATMAQGAEMVLEDAREALAVTERLTQGRPLPVLVDARGLKSQSKEARECFSGPEAGRVCAAVALWVESPVSRLIGNFFLRQHLQSTPTRLFTDEPQAVAWLLTHSR